MSAAIRKKHEITPATTIGKATMTKAETIERVNSLMGGHIDSLWISSKYTIQEWLQEKLPESGDYVEDDAQKLTARFNEHMAQHSFEVVWLWGAQ